MSPCSQHDGRADEKNKVDSFSLPSHPAVGYQPPKGPNLYHTWEIGLVPHPLDTWTGRQEDQIQSDVPMISHQTHQIAPAPLQAKPRGCSDDYHSGKRTEMDIFILHPSGVAFSCFLMS